MRKLMYSRNYYPQGVLVYRLVDLATGSPLYVGCTNDAAVREGQHNAPLSVFKRLGYDLYLEVLERVSSDDAWEAEKRWCDVVRPKYGLSLSRAEREFDERIHELLQMRAVAKEWAADLKRRRSQPPEQLGSEWELHVCNRFSWLSML